MRFNGYLFLASRYNKKSILESLLIVLAIGIGIAVLMVAQLFINSEKKVTDEIEAKDIFRITHHSNVSVDDFFFTGKFTPLIVRGDAGSTTKKLNVSDYLTLHEEFKEIAFVYVKSIITVDSEVKALTVAALSPNYFTAMGFELEKGELFTYEDFCNANQVAVLGADFAKIYFPDTDPIGKEIFILGIGGCKILGVLKAAENERFLRLNDWGKEADRLVYIPYTTMYCPKYSADFERLATINLDNCNLQSIDVEFFEGQNELFNLKEELQEAMLAHNMEHLIIKGPLQSNANLKMSIYVIFLINAITSLALLVAGINIMNLMLARVLKRAKSYGLSVALGSTKKGVIFQVLIEMVLLGFLGGFIGSFLAFGVSSYLVKARLCPGLLFCFKEVFVCFTLSFILSAIFVLYPALQISKINPADMLRSS